MRFTDAKSSPKILLLLKHKIVLLASYAMHHCQGWLSPMQVQTTAAISGGLSRKQGLTNNKDIIKKKHRNNT